jgi:hypothetical protein
VDRALTHALGVLRTLRVRAPRSSAPRSSEIRNSILSESAATGASIPNCTFTSLSVIRANDVNFTLGVTAVDSHGDVASTTEALTVKRPGACALIRSGERKRERRNRPQHSGDLSRLTGDQEAGQFASLVVAAIPIGAALSDGTHKFKRRSETLRSIHSWNLPSLTIALADDKGFALSMQQGASLW